MTERDVEKEVGSKYFVATLRRIADAIEAGEPIRIQVAGERLVVPVGARMQVAHEVEDGEHELEFEFAWSSDAGEESDDKKDDGGDEEG